MNKLSMIVTTILLFSAPAFAIDLSGARSQGLVGETQAGYVARINGGAEVAELVSEVNLKRRAEYERISAENGQSIDVVAKIAAGEIINNLPQGAKYKDNKGKWATK